jgi:hypothetical protein
VKKLFPSKKNSITQDMVDYLNMANNDPEFNGDEFVNTLLDYQGIMNSNGASLTEYMRAIKFCAYLETEETLVGAYIKARCDEDFVKSRMGAKPGSMEYNALSSAASRYRKTALVVKILTQSDMPLYLMFQGYRYKAVSVLAKEMVDAQYSRDRIAAAKALLESVKPPENVKIELDVGVKENSAVQSLNDQLAQFASSSLIHLQAGTTDLTKLGSMKAKEEILDAEVTD